MKDIILEAIQKKAIKKLVLSKSIDKEVIKAELKLYRSKNDEEMLQLERFLKDGKALHENVPICDANQLLDKVLDDFKQWNLFTTAGECQGMISKKGKLTVINRMKKELEPAQLQSHDKKLNYIIEEGTPVDFLIELGVMDEEGRVFKKKRDKFKQINRFLEYIEDVLPMLPLERTLEIADLCCGKSYLSFAVYYFLTKIKGLKVNMVGIDLKSDVIEECQQLCEKVHYDGLSFICDDIANFKPKRAIDMVISLHACDIATDIVLSYGVKLGAGVILSSPCCHHEIAQKWVDDKYNFVTDYGILKQRLSEVLTDAVRARALELFDYNVQVIEFIEINHTPKNLLIRATKKAQPLSEKQREKLRGEIKDFCETLGVTPKIVSELNI